MMREEGPSNESDDENLYDAKNLVRRTCRQIDAEKIGPSTTSSPGAKAKGDAEKLRRRRTGFRQGYVPRLEPARGTPTHPPIPSRKMKWSRWDPLMAPKWNETKKLVVERKAVNLGFQQHIILESQVNGMKVLFRQTSMEHGVWAL